MARRSDHLGVLTAALVASLMLLYSTRSNAEPITFDMCGDQPLAFRQQAGSDKLEVFCGKVPPKGDATPAPFNFVGCVGPKVTLVGGKYTVSCTTIIPYKTVKQ